MLEFEMWPDKDQSEINMHQSPWERVRQPTVSGTGSFSSSTSKTVALKSSPTASAPDSSTLKHSNSSPFGGCSRLLSQYRVVGCALIDYENDLYKVLSVVSRSFCQFKRYQSFRSEGRVLSDHLSDAEKGFREAVSFVPGEVLNSYLEDLLDLNIEDSKLFISKKNSGKLASIVTLILFLSTIALGCFALTSGAPIVNSLLIATMLALPVALYFHIVPQGRIARRIAFAKVVSRETARRRGSDGDSTTISIESPVVRKLLTQVPSAQGAALSL